MKILPVNFTCYMLDSAGNQSTHQVSLPFNRNHCTTEQQAARIAEDTTGLRFDWMCYTR